MTDENVNQPQKPTPGEQAATTEGQQPVAPSASVAESTIPAAPASPAMPIPAGSMPQQPVPQTPAVPHPMPQESANASGGGKAPAALICGICAIVFSGTVIIGLILGIIAIVLASQYIKAFGKEGKATGGKVCGIIGIIGSVLMLALYIVMFAFTVAVLDDYANSPYASSYSTYEKSQQASSEEIAAVKQIVTNQFDVIKNIDPALVDEISAQVDSTFVNELSYSMTDLGVDPKQFATWLMGDMSYAVEDSDVSISSSTDRGNVALAVKCRDIASFSTSLLAELQAFTASGGLDALQTEADSKAKVGELINSAMTKTLTTERSVSVDVDKKDGVWKVNEVSMQNAVGELFGFEETSSATPVL